MRRRARGGLGRVCAWLAAQPVPELRSSAGLHTAASAISFLPLELARARRAVFVGSLCLFGAVFSFVGWPAIITHAKIEQTSLAGSQPAHNRPTTTTTTTAAAAEALAGLAPLPTAAAATTTTKTTFSTTSSLTSYLPPPLYVSLPLSLSLA